MSGNLPTFDQTVGEAIDLLNNDDLRSFFLIARVKPGPKDLDEAVIGHAGFDDELLDDPEACVDALIDMYAASIKNLADDIGVPPGTMLSVINDHFGNIEPQLGGYNPSTGEVEGVADIEFGDTEDEDR